MNWNEQNILAEKGFTVCDPFYAVDGDGRQVFFDLTKPLRYLLQSYGRIHSFDSFDKLKTFLEDND
jgi:hypothetical protein